jgi:hypothetical protein
MKGEFFNEVDQRYGKILISGWVNLSVARHQNAIADGKVYRQDNQRRELPRELVDHYLAIVPEEII